MKPGAFLLVAALACLGCAPQFYNRNAVVVDVINSEPSEHRPQVCESEWPKTVSTLGGFVSALLNRNCTLCQVLGIVRQTGLIGGSVASDLVKQAGNANIRAHRIYVPLPDDSPPYTVETEHRPDGTVHTTVAPCGREAPSSKHQITNKHQASSTKSQTSSKHQIPNHKQASSTNVQAAVSEVLSSVWDLVLR